MEEKFKGLNLWKNVCMTDKSHTKDVSFGRKITAIDAYQQIKNFTEQFGACGIGWGYHCDIISANPDVCIVKLDLWIKDEGSFTEHGTCEWRSSKGKLDSDAPKKATTDALTKAFSRLGFNADIFLGMFEDNRYVEYAQQELAKKNNEKSIQETNEKNKKLIEGRFAPLKDAAALADMVEKIEKHFAPIYSKEVGQFFHNPYFSEIVEKKCKELSIDSKEILGG